MDFRFTPEQDQFRRELREFIAQQWGVGDAASSADEDSDDEWERRHAFRQALVGKGWLVRNWPVECGGQGANEVDRAIFTEELALAGAPGVDQGIDRVGPTLMIYGSEDQKQRFLPAIARAEITWCQGFSEPGSGSDLASLQTRAVHDGDSFLITGQKIWTSHAQRADWIFLLARTDSEAPKHRGISFFLIELRSPGITVERLINIAGTPGFNQVFFDSVRVPRENLVGELHRGWYIATAALDFERAGVNRIAAAGRVLDQIATYLRETGLEKRTEIRSGLAQLRVEFEIGRILAYRVAWMLSRGIVPSREASISKLFGSEMQQRLAGFAINVLGMQGQLAPDSRWSPLAGQIERYYLSSVALTIAAGTSEIQRNIIATRGLGLPRD